MIVLDIETTGTDPRVHSIASIGAVDFDQPEREFYEQCKIFDGAKIEKEALAVNGFTEEQLHDQSKKTEAEIVKAFLDWAKQSNDHTMSGQNPNFDTSFVIAAAERNHLDFSMPRRTVDLHSICLAHMIWKGKKPPIANNRSNLNSDSIMKYVGIPPEIHPHKAINGARIEAEAFSRLLYNKPFFESYKAFKIPWL
ncbi:MAG: 3'-5' exonuclease [Candidatus Paceibacterota bacterium]